MRELKITPVLLIALFAAALTLFAQGEEPGSPDNLPIFYPASGAEPADSPLNIQSDNPTEEDALMLRINGLRQRTGTTCLNISERLRDAAYGHAKDMHDRGYYGITDPDGNNIGDRAIAEGYDAAAIGGGLSAGTEGIRDTAIEAYFDLTSRRAYYLIMLLPNWRDVGAGFFSGTQNYEDYWSVIYGEPVGGSTPTACPETTEKITDIPDPEPFENLNTTRPTFNWKRLTAATALTTPGTFYDIEILDSADNVVIRAPTDFQGATYPTDCICQGVNCSLTLQDELEPGDTYKVYLRAYSPTGAYTWTTKPTEITIPANATAAGTTPSSTTCLPATPVELTGPTGTITDPSGNPTYIWQRNAGTTSYELYVAEQSNLGQPFLYGRFDTSRHCDDTTCRIEDAASLNEQFRLPNGTYNVYIREWLGESPSTQWSVPFVFRMEALPPAAVTVSQISYLTDTRITLPTFNWTLDGTAANAYWFRVYVAPATNLGNAITDKWVSRMQACGSLTSTTCHLQSEGDVTSSAQHNIYILSWGPGGFSIGGLSGYATGSFTLPNPAPDVPDSLTASVVNGRVKLDFIADENAAWYQVRVESSGQTVSQSWYPRSPQTCTGLTCTIFPDVDLPAATYQLYLQAWGPGGFNNNSATAESVAQTLNLQIAAPGVVSDVQVSAPNSGRPDFSWQSAERATWYNLVILSSAGQIYLNDWYKSSDIGCLEGGTCDVSPNAVLFSGAYSYYIGTWGSGGFGTGGLSGYVQGNFNVNAQTAQPPQPITPTSGLTATNADISFQWEHQSDASWYEITINAGSFAQSDYMPIYYAWTPVEALGCRDDNICALNLPDVRFGTGNYAWTIRAYTPAGIGEPSANQLFEVDLP